MALSAKQKIFVQEYLVDLNATAAAGRAGYKDPNIGRQLITKNNVSAAIAEAMKQRETRTQITADRVLQELAKIGFGDATDYAEVITKEVPTVVTMPDGTKETQMVERTVVELRDTKKLSADVCAAIAGIKEGKHGIEVTRYDKIKALELMGRHLGLFDRQETFRQPPTEDDPLTKSLKEEAVRLEQEGDLDGDQ